MWPRIPRDAKGRYTLGRVHYLAFHVKRDHEPAFVGQTDQDGLTLLSPQWMLDRGMEDGRADREIKPCLPQRCAQHALEGVKNLREAVRLAPKEALYELGLAALMSEFLTYRLWEVPKPKTLPKELAEHL